MSGGPRLMLRKKAWSLNRLFLGVCLPLVLTGGALSQVPSLNAEVLLLRCRVGDRVMTGCRFFLHFWALASPGCLQQFA